MEIFFCDLCNESVPLSDLDKGLAFRRGDRVVCATCDRAMSGETEAGMPAPAGGARGGGATLSQRQSPVAQAAPSGGGSGTLLALVALLFAAGGFALLIDRIDQVREGSERTERDLELTSTRLDNRYEKLSSGIEEKLLVTEERIRTKRDAERTVIEGALDSVRGGVEQQAARFDGLETDISEMRLAAVKGEAERKARVDRLADQIIQAEKDLRFYNDRLIELQENLRGIMAGGGLNLSAGADPGATMGSQEGTPAWTGLLADLKHKNSGIRLDTLYALAETRDARVIPHIVPMLEDSDLFVRMGTARILQDLDAREAVFSLISALEDPESAVRESAMVALRAITGRDFRFEPVASQSERTKRVKAWRDWWKKSGADFLGASE